MTDFERFKLAIVRASRNPDGEEFIHEWWERFVNPLEEIHDFEDMAMLAYNLAEAYGIIEDEN